MSISSRINEMSTHIEQAYDELQGLGADLTNVNKNIENISMVLDDIYDSMPQVSGEGTSLTLDDTRVGKIKSTLKGNTSQTTYSGKNLLPNDTETKTRNGITITKNSDGTYKVNGTATSDVSEAICNSFIPMSGTWRMLGCPSGGSASTYMLSAYVGYWGEGSPNIDTGNGTNITYTGNVKVRFYIKSGTTCNNLIFKPMLEAGSQVTSYEPYVGGIPSPNPSYPQPVNVVSGDNEINVVGKNILENTFQSQTANGITFTRNDDGSLSFSGTATQAHSITGRFTNDLVLKAGTSYTFSLGNKQAGYGVYLQQAGNVNVYYLGVSATNSSLTITPTEDTTITQLAIHFPNGNSVNGTIYPMLEVGSSASTYEPYQGNTYNVDLPVENLLDLTSLNPNQVGQQVSNIQENSFIMSGTAMWGNEYFFYENTNKNTTYTASCKYLSSLARKSGLSIYGTNETTGENLTTINSLLVDIPANVETPVTNTFNSGNYDYIVFRYWNNATATALSSRVDLYVKEVQLEKGSKQNNFTPYGTTPIELCKIGDYQDYIYKEGKKWYLHKDFIKIIFTGVGEEWSLQSSTYMRSKAYSSVYDITNSQTADAFCNVASVISMNGLKVETDNRFALQSSNRLWFRVSSFSTAELWASYLKNRYESGNPVYIIIPLETSTNTEITYQPLIEQLNNIEKAMSYDTQTNISQANNDLPFIISASALKEWQENTSLNSTLSMVNPLSLGNTLNTQENDTQPIEVDNIEPLEEEENEES